MVFLKRILLKKYRIIDNLNSFRSCKRFLKILLPENNYINCVSSIPNEYSYYKKPFFSPKTINSSTFTDTEEITGIYPYTDNTQLSVKNILFNDCNNDALSEEISKCASVEEIFTLVRNNENNFNYKHLAQLVSILQDLQNIVVYHYHTDEEESVIEENFLKKLYEHKEFFTIIKLIDSKIDKFDPTFLCSIMVNLFKIGYDVNTKLIQDLAINLRNFLLKDFSLYLTSQLLKVVFTEPSIRPYYVVIDLIPKIYKEIELVKTASELEDLTLCIFKLSDIISDEILLKYEAKLLELIEENKLTENDYLVILKAISLLNVTKWRNRFSTTTSKCIFLIKNSIELLNVQEMQILYNIFFKNQEPGEVLNIIQRAAAKLLNEIDETHCSLKNKLQLFSSLIYFSSPINKHNFRQDLEKYLNDSVSFNTVLIQRNIFSYLKVSNNKIWNDYWNKVCQLIKKENEFNKVQRVMEAYIYFCGDVAGIRHYTFEHHLLNIIQKNYNAGYLTMYPSRFFSSLAFGLLSCYDRRFLDRLIGSFKELSGQLSTTDIFKISYILNLINQRKTLVTDNDITEIKEILFRETTRLYEINRQDSINIAMLAKAAIVRKDLDNNHLIDDMLTDVKETRFMSSKLMEFVCFNLISTKTLIPEVLNLCSNYIAAHKDFVLGFNAEKLLFLLFDLNYHPIFEDDFFSNVINIIIRDQERMSGLGFIQSALALSFFNRLPKTFIKKVFNVEFLDKLDIELANCYCRDKYPFRVRNALMQLNRAVCLEYPEYNIPWFHQKYVEEFQKNNAIDDVTNYFHRSVKGYLKSSLGENKFLERVTVPYGYTIDFVFYLNKNNEPTDDHNNPSTRKFAVLLKNNDHFTRLYVRLRGKHALKIKHLEILGYKVKMIKRNDWENLLYAEERKDYIKNILFS